MEAPQILIIDDDLTVMESVLDILGSTGHQVVGTYGGPEGVDLLKEHIDSVKVVLVDFRMPSWDGLETIVELRKVNPDVYCVLTTGESQPPRSEQATDVPNEYLYKPFNLSNLTAVIERGLNRSE